MFNSFVSGTNFINFSRVFLSACAATLFCASNAAHADATDDYVRAQMAKKQIPGFALAVLKDNQLVKESVYGVANVELNVPATLDTSFTLASMTKIFTTSAIMLLVQDGKITLDESVTKVLPQLPAKWAHVTIRNCLSHTSGLPDNVTDDINLTPVAGSRDALLKILAEKPVQPVGEKSAYNQTGFTILGMIIEKISGMSFEDFMQTRVFKPANITDAKYGDGWAIIPGRADLYTALSITDDHSKLLRDEQGNPVLLKDHILHYGSKYMPDYLKPAGLLNGSIRDLVNWELTLNSGKLVSAESLALMSTPYQLKTGKEGDFGLGFLTASFGGPYKAVSYGGGAATWRISYPEKHLTVIVLTNLQDSQPEAMAAEIAALYEPDVASKNTQ